MYIYILCTLICQGFNMEWRPTDNYWRHCFEYTIRSYLSIMHWLVFMYNWIAYLTHVLRCTTLEHAGIVKNEGGFSAFTMPACASMQVKGQSVLMVNIHCFLPTSYSVWCLLGLGLVISAGHVQFKSTTTLSHFIILPPCIAQKELDSLLQSIETFTIENRPTN